MLTVEVYLDIMLPFVPRYGVIVAYVRPIHRMLIPIVSCRVLSR